MMKAKNIRFILLVMAIPLVMVGNKLVTNTTSSRVDPRRVLEEIQHFYAQHESIYHQITYALYANHTATEPYSVDKGVFIKQGNTQYAQLAGIESLTTETYTIGVDHEEQIVMISNHLSLPPTGPLPNADEWLTDEAVIRVEEASEGLEVLTIQLATGEVEQAAITYQQGTYQPEKLVLTYRQAIQLEAAADAPWVQPRLEIQYTKTQFGDFAQALLAVSSYLTQEGNDWTLAQKYQGYELINNIREYSAF